MNALAGGAATNMTWTNATRHQTLFQNTSFWGGKVHTWHDEKKVHHKANQQVRGPLQKTNSILSSSFPFICLCSFLSQPREVHAYSLDSMHPPFPLFRLLLRQMDRPYSHFKALSRQTKKPFNPVKKSPY
jgi:hypothetical protein